jgi:uncharacterized membrane protein
MTDQATQQMHIEAPVEEIWGVLTDFDRYPSWARDLKDVSVLQHDEQGRAVLVRFRAAAMGRSTSYTLRYDWSAAPDRLSWSLVTGDIMRALDGTYELRPSNGGADVAYHLSVELVIPLPAFVKRRAEARIVNTALQSLRAHVTS